MEGDKSQPTQLDEQGFPPQHHAGRVGYGPNYDPTPTIGEIISGIKEELKGKIQHNPELIKHGRDVRTGEEKLRKLAGEDKPSKPIHERDAGSTSQGSASNKDSPNELVKEEGTKSANI